MTGSETSDAPIEAATLIRFARTLRPSAARMRGETIRAASLARSMPRLTVAIPTYNRRDLMDVVLPPVLAQELEGELDVVVVDDGSTDGTADYVRERWPSVRVVEQDNRGISAAMNRCLEEGAGSAYVALLNNDVEVAPGWAAAIVAALEADAKAG